VLRVVMPELQKIYFNWCGTPCTC